MRRLNIFEFEDFHWFPNMWRKSMTRLIVVAHRMFKSELVIANSISALLEKTGEHKVIDLCSGSGGPMLNVYHALKVKHPELSITLTDLFPNQEEAKRINGKETEVKYEIESVNAGAVPEHLKGVRTMVCSFHHMPPEVAKGILADAQASNQPIFIFELSDNSIPHWIAWTAFPINILMCFVLTFFVRPLTWYQVLFTFVIPVIPIAYAWDGAVSNVRTYAASDLDLLIGSLEKAEYTWEKQLVKQGTNKFLTLTGMPKK